MPVDRKALIREYKQRRPPMGVYRVHNTATGNALVAASTDLPSILNRHKSQLSMGGHSHKALQTDWNEHGAGSFVFEVLDTLTAPEGQPDYDPTEDLRVLEEMWVERLQVTGERGYGARARLDVVNPR